MSTTSDSKPVKKQKKPDTIKGIPIKEYNRMMQKKHYKPRERTEKYKRLSDETKQEIRKYNDAGVSINAMSRLTGITVYTLTKFFKNDNKN